MKTIDFAKDLKGLYTATCKVKDVNAERGTFLYVADKGEPGGAAFQDAIGTLYAAAYTIKFTLKNAGVLDFKVPKLECVWYVDDAKKTPAAEWAWRLMLRLPDGVTNAHLKEARKALKEKKGLDLSAVRRISWREGRAIQMMHAGPYDNLSETYAKLEAHASETGVTPKGGCHEIYMNDPRRVAPEKLKTIVRMPIALPRPSYARGRASGR